MDDFGKMRIYTCVCGTLGVRPLRPNGPVLPCTRCGTQLEGRSYAIEDSLVFAKKVLAGAMPPKPKE